MALTHEFRTTVKERAERDPRFRRALLREAIENLLAGDLETGKLILRDYINATIGFEELGAQIKKSPKSLMRMLSPSGNPRADNLFEMIAFLQVREGVQLEVTVSD
jgi:hypothetical protein